MKDIDEKNQGYFQSVALQVTILHKVSKFLAFSRKWVGKALLHGKMNLDVKILIYASVNTTHSWYLAMIWLHCIISQECNSAVEILLAREGLAPFLVVCFEI